MYLTDGFDLDGIWRIFDLVVVRVTSSSFSNWSFLGGGGFRVGCLSLLAAEQLLFDVAVDPSGSVVIFENEAFFWDVDEGFVLVAEVVEKALEYLQVHLVWQVVSLLQTTDPERALLLDERDLGLAQRDR